MRGKLKVVMVFSTLFLTMCSSFANETTYQNGLSCKNYSDYRIVEGRRAEGANCSYVCPDGSVRETNISDTTSPLYAASRAELDARFCGIALQTTPTEPPATSSPTVIPSATVTVSPTAQAPATVGTALTLEASVTAAIPATGQSAVLTGRVTMCDTGGDLISFRIVQPPPDLTGKALSVLIAEQESACYVNQTNPSLMTCTLPAGVTFPVNVVVNLDGVVVNDFIYGGLYCTEVTTPAAITTP